MTTFQVLIQWMSEVETVVRRKFFLTVTKFLIMQYWGYTIKLDQISILYVRYSVTACFITFFCCQLVVKGWYMPSFSLFRWWTIFCFYNARQYPKKPYCNRYWESYRILGHFTFILFLFICEVVYLSQHIRAKHFSSLFSTVSNFFSSRKISKV